MAFDVLKWMKEDMGFSEAEIAAVQPAMTPERIAKLEGGYLRQGDYSKHMNDLRAAQDKLNTENERLTTEMAVWAETQAAGGELTAKQQKALNEAEARVLKAQQKVRELATRAGVDPEAQVKEIMGDGVVTPPTGGGAPPPAIDTSQFLTAEHQQRLALLSLDLATEIPAIAEEHFQLTGERLNTRALRAEIVTRATTKGNKKPTGAAQVWEEMFDIPTKRTAAAEKKHTEEISAAEKRGRDAAMSEMALPGGGPRHEGSRPHSPIINRFTGPEHKPIAQRPATQETVANAAAAFRSGKYRQDTTAGAGKAT